MDREAWHDAVHRILKSLTRLSNWTEVNWTYQEALLQDQRVLWRGQGSNGPENWAFFSSLKFIFYAQVRGSLTWRNGVWKPFHMNSNNFHPSLRQSVHPELWHGAQGPGSHSRHWGEAERRCLDFPHGPGDKDLPVHAGDMGLIPGPGRFHTNTEQLISCTASELVRCNCWSLSTLESVLPQGKPLEGEK